MFQHALDDATIDFEDQLYADIARGLITSHCKVSVAESLTGGLLSHHLMKRPGSSRYFSGGVVAYTPLLKVKLCGVLPKTIADNGIVSAAVAREMVEGIARITGSEYALSVTGVAGPAVTDQDKDLLGTVYMGILCPDRTEVKRFRFKGDRSHVILQTVQTGLGILRNYVKVFATDLS
jgi:PncC family amidohydrolase